MATDAPAGHRPASTLFAIAIDSRARPHTIVRPSRIGGVAMLDGHEYPLAAASEERLEARQASSSDAP